MSDGTITVTGIQGNPVSPEYPSDKDSLTWSAEDGYWVGRYHSLNKVIFTSDGYWTVPDGVTNVIVYAFGGGSGGTGSASGNVGGNGGNGSLLQSAHLTVIPGEVHEVKIGAGGLGGPASGPGVAADDSFPGGDTLLGNIFRAIGANATSYVSTTQNFPGAGGYGSLANQPGKPGLKNTSSVGGLYNGGPGGVSDATHASGGGGGQGPMGNGAAGGSGNSTIGIQPGFSAAPNTGAGGGGAAVSGTQSTDGGAGGSGYLCVVF